MHGERIIIPIIDSELVKGAKTGKCVQKSLKNPMRKYSDITVCGGRLLGKQVKSHTERDRDTHNKAVPFDFCFTYILLYSLLRIVDFVLQPVCLFSIERLKNFRSSSSSRTLNTASSQRQQKANTNERPGSHTF